MRTDNISGVTANFALDTRIDVKVNFMEPPINEREKNARQGFVNDLQELADFVNSTLGPNLLQMWENVQKAKVGNTN